MPYKRSVGTSLYGRWFVGEPMLTPRSGHVAVALGGLIYCIGGFDGVNWLAVNEVYDPASNTWVSRALMPTPRDSAAAAVLNGKIHVVGGYGPSGALAVHEIYDPKTDTWVTAPNLPGPPRWYLQAASLYNRLFVFGGYDGVNARTETHSYSPEATNWLTEAGMLHGRYLAGAAAAGGKIYAVAGRSAAADNLNEAYDPLTRQWVEEVPLPGGKQDTKTVVLNGRIHALDKQGMHAEYRGWWTFRSPLPLPRDQFGAAAVGEKIFVVGGYKEGVYMNRLDIFTPLEEET